MQIRQVPVSEPGAAVSFDSLPVCQLNVFPDPPGHDLPFAQARIYAEQGRSLFLKLSAYEADAPADSRFLASFGTLALEVSPNGSRLTLDGKPLENAAVRVTPMRGDDLQGEFWGAVVQLPLSVLRLALPSLTLLPGGSIPFALTKSSDLTGYRAALFDGEGSLALSAF